MSEDFHQLPGELEESEQPPTKAGSPAEGERPQPISESVIPEQPIEAQEAAQPQYPPPPEFYAQMPAVDRSRVAGSGSAALPPMPAPIAPSVQTAPVFPPPGYGFPLPGYGYEPLPQAQPLPLGQAVRELPQQYKKILLKPGPRSFAEEQGKADWGIIWLQVIFLTILQVVTSVSMFRDYNQFLATNQDLASSGMDLSIFSSGSILPLEITMLAIIAPLLFFATAGIQYLVARAFKGSGNFKQQAYNQILFQMPIMVVSVFFSLIALIFSGGMLTGSSSASSVSGLALLVLLLIDLISLGINIYSVVLNVFALMAAHRFSGGKATASVLIPYGILIVLALLCACALSVVLAVATSGSPQP